MFKIILSLIVAMSFSLYAVNKSRKPPFGERLYPMPMHQDIKSPSPESPKKSQDEKKDTPKMMNPVRK